MFLRMSTATGVWVAADWPPATLLSSSGCAGGNRRPLRNVLELLSTSKGSLLMGHLLWALPEAFPGDPAQAVPPWLVPDPSSENLSPEGR